MRCGEIAAAMGNWWLAASLQQGACLLQSFMVKREIIQVTQPACSPHLTPYDFCLFPKLKSPLRGKRFQTIDEIQENMMGQLMAIPAKDFAVFWTVEETLEEVCEVMVWLLWRGLRGHCPRYNVSCIFFNKCLFFRLQGWILSGHTSLT